MKERKTIERQDLSQPQSLVKKPKVLWVNNNNIWGGLNEKEKM